MSGDRFFGFWISVQDESNARYAVQMAGLPVLALGANAAVLALSLAMN